MPSSNQKTIQLNIESLIAKAVRMVGLSPESVPAEIHDTAHLSLNMILGELMNMSICPQWLIREGGFALQNGVGTYRLTSDGTANGDELGVREIRSMVILDPQGGYNSDVPYNLNAISDDEWNLQTFIDNGKPYNFFFHQLNLPEIRFQPIPDDAYRVRFFYLAKPDVVLSSLDDTDLNDRWFSYLLHALALKLCLEVSGGLERYEVLQNEYNKCLANLEGAEDNDLPIQFEHNVFSC